jgi:hypothetical protein
MQAPKLSRRWNATRTSLGPVKTSIYTILFLHISLNFYLTAPSALSFSISFSLNPKLSLKISSVCCPNIGGKLLMLGLLSLYFTGVLTILTGPHHSCSISFTMSRARTCSWFNVPWISFTAEYGKPEPSKTSSHSCVVLVCVMVSIRLSSSTRFATRDVLMANLGSVFHSG